MHCNLESSLCSMQLEKSLHSSEDLAQPKKFKNGWQQVFDMIRFFFTYILNRKSRDFVDGLDVDYWEVWWGCGQSLWPEQLNKWRCHWMIWQRSKDPPVQGEKNQEFCHGLLSFWASQLIKNLPAMWDTWVWSLGWKDPLEKGKATYSSSLAWRNPWTVQSIASQRVRHDRATFNFLHFCYIQ